MLLMAAVEEPAFETDEDKSPDFHKTVDDIKTPRENPLISKLAQDF